MGKRALARSSYTLVTLFVGVVVLVARPARADADTSANSQPTYESQIRPLLHRYCDECHSEDVAEADIDLAAFETLLQVKEQPKVWLKVRDMLDSRQMPPIDARQPNDGERTTLRDWVRDLLAAEAEARAGDPGPVILRRLSNAEYNYTIRDLTGVDSLDPTREFPVDGAAGEGFTNVGSGQGMSPAFVQKYLDAAKEVADHAVLLPDDVRFSRHTTRRDQTDELMARIQAFYRRFTQDGGGTAVNLQGIKFDTNQGGRLPPERYLAATLAERESLQSGQKTVESVARDRSLNARYLATLWHALTQKATQKPSPPLDALREKWRRAGPGDAHSLAAEIESHQKALWKFNPVGHIGREGGPTSWMEAVSPVTTAEEVRFKLPSGPPGADMVFYLVAGDFGDGNEQDFVVWRRPRIEFKPNGGQPARPPILLKDVRSLTEQLDDSFASQKDRTKEYLDAIIQLKSSPNKLEDVAQTNQLNPQLLEKWAALVRLSERRSEPITGHFTQKISRGGGHDAINGWGSPQTPSLLTNRSDKPISLGTPTAPARSVTVHPSPSLAAYVAWQSPLDARVRITGRVADADRECGNGVAWRLELLSDSGRAVLSSGVIENGGDQPFQLDNELHVKRGDVVSLVVNARNRDHVCDTTQIELKVAESTGQRRVWNLASDIVDRVLAGNPLPDAYGNAGTWHFCSRASDGEDTRIETHGPVIPPGSALARWRAAVVASKPADEIAGLALAVQRSLTVDGRTQLAEPDASLRRQLLTGLDKRSFGKHPHDLPVDEADLCVRAPQIIEVWVPAALAAGGEYVATASLHGQAGELGSVQVQVLAARPAGPAVSLARPVIVSPAASAKARMEAALDEFRKLFPPALCYARIVPVDEVVTLTLYHREDDQLERLMLDTEQAAQLDRLWDQLRYVSREPLKLAVVFEQLSEFATQDRPDLVKAFEPLRDPINRRADAFRQRLIATEPAHVRAVLQFADEAWRRPLTKSERQELSDLYQALRDNGLPHEEAIQLLLVRVLTSPRFLFKLEEPGPGTQAAPVTDLELAARLSYFLWSSLPDNELRLVAQAGKLTDDAELTRQTRRMLTDPRVRRLAIHFACQWLHVRDFDQNDDKNEKLYPEFASLRDDMYEETMRFFEDMFRNDGSILDILGSNHTFLNDTLAQHYGIGGIQGSDWQRREDVRPAGRGGVLGMATVLASQSGASRTSPILRGNWVYETLLGERLPRPPANVPQLPEAVPDGLTARQLIERHSSAPACAKCHVKIDPYGFALEQYDAIGRLRPDERDTKTVLPSGQQIEGIDGLREYLLKDRQDDVIRQFCRKLLGYALGRELQMSDEPLLNEMQTKLAANGFRFGVAVEIIVHSRQFRDIRGRQFADD